MISPPWLRSSNSNGFVRIGSLLLALALTRVGTSYAASSSALALVFLHTFAAADGTRISSLVEGPDASFHETIADGGTNQLGAVFELTPSGDFKWVHSFSGPDGSGPLSLSRGVDGFLYGTTNRGGAMGAGTIFRLSLSGTLTTVYSFGTMPIAMTAKVRGAALRWRRTARY